MDAMAILSTCWAHTFDLGASMGVETQFLSYGVYCANCLRKLFSTLRRAGLRNEKVFRKLRNATDTAQMYGLQNSSFNKQ